MTATSPEVAAYLRAPCIGCGAERSVCRVKRHLSGRACCVGCDHRPNNSEEQQT